ncbi:hypothetical protein [Peteryoungia ipomoeae]|uniref:Uncharacterized protein n=1 Tax=Peteryoungia ipomoeae TaxID=1210932 RepID=A0A4S8P4L0_9HYPH|nr:hypothetical protein [Peteryoungia ipomoeae]THV25013.1 hypothetical protein FAA97_02050 [Peteryoungia ipomoeae]
MTKVSLWIAHCICAVAILVQLLVRGSEYDWMHGMDASIETAQIESAGNRAVIAGLALVLALASQGFVAASTRSTAERRLSFALAAGSALLFLTG